ncbi:MULTISPECIES: FAD-dependent oxidoreductase [Streptomyces]|uniref:FAD-dependent monooxygenase n=1 Tax=Streptomyces ureilyticus TaxID=1775131 RepID=A0ABX0DP69_9ACTN|nr:NAD(P)/FAD-dependent oxidoreductase [Streptomyces ureilyticus]NGO43533.1 FAD-dependent monooxygenase [Streptomyces ureilyticus]WSZ19089.1 FAD-dependent monooxygenase [Streptomyces canus]WSZ29536.1 FAD-dependent monooxygenase [Streptomyces sp. NBC_00882]WSZ63601.1 FAD-dependent monooxygenase [Streptomyces canus]
MQDAQVVVAGAGPVGLLTALGLARAGLDVTVLEAASGIEPRPYDMVYHWAVLPGLEDLGLLEELCQAGVVAHTRSFVVPSTGERLVLDLRSLTDEVEHPFELLVPSHVLARIVVDRLARHPRVRFEWGTRLTDVWQDSHGVTVTADTPHGVSTLRAAWLVGADGAHSQVRRSLGMGFPGVTWPKRFVAADIRFDLAGLGMSPSSWQLDLDNGALIGLADDTGLWRYTFAESRLLPEETISDRMSAVFKAVLPHGADPLLESWAASRVHERAAESFRSGRVVLAGDAAHVTNPSRGFGLACGIFDALALARLLVSVVHGDAEHTVLDQYAEDRRKVFEESVSPLSAQAMRLLFLTESPERFAEGVEHCRRMAADPHLLRGHLLESLELRGTLFLP